MKSCPIETGNSQYVDVYNKVTQVEVGDQLVKTRSVALDLTNDAKNGISKSVT